MLTYSQVVGQGGVQLHRATFDSGREAVTAINASFPVTHAMVPRAKVLGVVAREDGELVADLIEVPVTCELEHAVRARGDVLYGLLLFLIVFEELSVLFCTLSSPGGCVFQPT